MITALQPDKRQNDPAHSNPFFLLTMLCVSPTNEETPALRYFAVEIARQCLDLANIKPATEAEEVLAEAARVADLQAVSTSSLPPLVGTLRAMLTRNESNLSAAERLAYQTVIAAALAYPLEAAFYSLHHAVCLHIISELSYAEFLEEAATTLSELIGDPFAGKSDAIVTRLRTFAANAIPSVVFSGAAQPQLVMSCST